MGDIVFGMSREHLDTIRGPIGWWAAYVLFAVFILIGAVAYFLPVLRELLFSGVLTAAAYLSNVFGI